MTDIILKRGDSNDQVTEVQKRLTELGFSTEGVDGDFGGNTEDAVQAFQSAYGLPPTGQVDGDTWTWLFTPPEPDPSVHDPSEGATADALVDLALHQVNDRYDMDMKVSSNVEDPNEDTFDCSGLIEWSCAQLGVTIAGWAAGQIDECAAAGLEIGVDEAGGIRGTLLYRPPTDTSTSGHVALSLGSGNETIEAMGTAYGVVVGTIGHRFTRAAYIPGIVY